MERTVAVVGWSVATVSTGLAVWAICRWRAAQRYVNSIVKEKYSTEQEIRKQLVHHYVNMENLTHLKDLIPDEAENYHKKLALFCSDMCIKYNKGSQFRVLDVGSGVGGTAFHLSHHFGEVVGTDICAEMRVVGKQLVEFGELMSPLSCEGGKRIQLYKMKVPSDSNVDSVTFWDLDACSLSQNAGVFDCILVSNVLTELDSPCEFLTAVSSCVAKGGLLIISDAFLWPAGPEAKLGGSGSELTSDLLHERLQACWTRVETTSLPYYMALTERVAQVARAQVMVWQRNEQPSS